MQSAGHTHRLLPLHNYTLTLERFEVSGNASLESATKPIVEDVQVLMVLFFGSAPTQTDVPVDAREDLLYINVDGGAARNTTLSLGFGERFGDRDLGELSRRTGIPLATFMESLGTLSQYRLFGGLLQRSVYQRSSGQYEWLTVIPMGDWRTVDHGATKHRLSLRRYIILLFHATPNCPHRGRDHTYQAIMDAGMWWSKLYSDVQGVIRSCLICASN